MVNFVNNRLIGKLMSKWIRFKFKNNLSLYLVLIWLAVALLSVLAIAAKEGWAVALLALLGVVATIGWWFGTHYGIKISAEHYLFICNHKIKKFTKAEVGKIELTFVKLQDGLFNAHAKVFANEQTQTFIWTEFYSIKGGALTPQITVSEAETFINELSQDEKFKVKII